MVVVKVGSLPSSCPLPSSFLPVIQLLLDMLVEVVRVGEEMVVELERRVAGVGT